MTATQADLFANDRQGAIFSPCRCYRYQLWRPTGSGTGRILWICLNPSRADATTDDPTIRIIRGFARRWGYRRFDVCNLFAWIATDPKELLATLDPIGPSNDEHIVRVAAEADLLLAAWGVGVPPAFAARPVELFQALGRPLHCLGRTIDGHPVHPLRKRSELQPQRFW